MAYNEDFVKSMEKYFYSSSENNEFDLKDVKPNAIVRFSFYDSDIPHFSKIGEGIVNAIYLDSIDIIINKNQRFFDASAYGAGINLDHGLFLMSKYEDSDIVIFNIPVNYIWGIKK